MSIEHITMQPIKVLVVNPRSLFEWLSFFLGGAAGAVIILGIERWLNRRQDQHKKEYITAAMDEEAADNLKQTAAIIKNITDDDRQMYNFNRFSTVWLDEYSQACIDYSDGDSLRLQSFVRGASMLIDQIHNIQEMLRLLHATGRSLRHFRDHIQTYNRDMLAITKELDVVLHDMKVLRKGNKVYKEDAMKS